MLEVQALRSGYSKALAVDDISFTLGTVGSLAILGRNGAGKSTVLKSVMGIIRPWSGSVHFNGIEISGWVSDRIARAGIGYVPEERRVFETLTVHENLLSAEKLGVDGTTTWSANRIFELFPEIARRRSAAAGTLSGGERQMLAIGRALMGNPHMLLLDEPSEGLAPVVVQRLGEALAALRNDKIAILLSEQNRRLARKLAKNVLILETGRIAYRGNFSDLDANPKISERLLGV